MYLPKSRTSFFESELQSYLELKIKMQFKADRLQIQIQIQSISNISSFHLNAPQMTVEIWSLKINEDVSKGLVTPYKAVFSSLQLLIDLSRQKHCGNSL